MLLAPTCYKRSSIFDRLIVALFMTHWIATAHIINGLFSALFSFTFVFAMCSKEIGMSRWNVCAGNNTRRWSWKTLSDNWFLIKTQSESRIRSLGGVLHRHFSVLFANVQFEIALSMQKAYILGNVQLHPALATSWIIVWARSIATNALPRSPGLDGWSIVLLVQWDAVKAQLVPINVPPQKAVPSSTCQ